jgi:hypothetical protein
MPLSALAAVWSSIALGQQYNWIGTTGTWSDSTNWDRGAVPPPGVEVVISRSDSLHRVITFDADYVAPLASFILRHTNTVDGSVTLNMTDGTRLQTIGTQTIGGAGATTFNHAGGVNVVGELLTVTSRYLIGGGTLSASDILSGGVIDQRGGNVAVANSLAVNNGIYSMSAGALQVSGDEVIPDLTTGAFEQSGGEHVVNGMIQLGRNIPSSGRLTLSGGRLSAASIHLLRAGQLIVSGGSLSTGSINAIGTASFVGTVTISGTGVVSTGSINVGPSGAIQLSGGTIASGLIFQNGTLNVASGSPQIIGFTPGPGSSNIVNGNLVLSGATANMFGVPIQGNGTLSTLIGASYSGIGVVTPSVVNAGTVTASGGNLNLNGAVVSNTGALVAAPGSNLFINAASFANAGNLIVNSAGSIVALQPVEIAPGKSVNVLGGTVSAPLVTNSAGGTVRGFGVLSASLVNRGSADFFGQTTIVGNASNELTGQLLIRNAQTLVLGSVTNHGTVTIASAGDLSIDGSMTISATGIVRFNAGSFSVDGLNITGGQFVVGLGADKVVRTKSIDVTSGGKLDLAQSAAVADYSGTSPIESVRGMIGSAHAGGAWTGSGIGSSLANASALGVGYAEASSLATIPPIFGSVDDTTVLVRLARYGDADLDGAVALGDFNRLAASFGQSNRFWHQGDFNYDAIVNLNDFNQLATNFGLSAAGPTVTPQDWSALAAAVPEAGVLTVAVPLLWPVLARRRARHCSRR